VAAGAVVVAAGTLNTPGLLARSGLEDPLIGRNLGFHPARLVFGRFDELQDAHVVYPITTHCADHRSDEDGGFVVEAVTMQDPIGFAVNLQDEHGPIWGEPLVEALRQYRYWTGLLMMVNDDNNGAVVPDLAPDAADDAFTCNFQAPRWSVSITRCGSVARHSRRPGRGRSFGPVCSRRTSREAAGWAATRPARSSTPTARRTRSGGCSSGDGSVIPRTLSSNPSLTIMALATRLADHLHADRSGYLAGVSAAVG